MMRVKSYGEKRFQSEFLQKNEIVGNMELKLVRGVSIRKDAIKPHQYEALEMAEKEGLNIRIEDSGFNPLRRFTIKKPFDCLRVKQSSYIVVMFYEPRKKKNVYYVPIKKWNIVGESKSYKEKEIKEMSVLFLSYLSIKTKKP